MNPDSQRLVMHFGQSIRYWNEIAAMDACWAVLVEPSRKFGGWESAEALAEFFATGEREVEAVLESLSELGLAVGRGRALDFGCGVGRLTRALAREFQAVDGLDISEQMIRRARELNAAFSNCRFVVNPHPDLHLLASDAYDFVYSSIVLQHVPSRKAVERYLREFARVLRTGGVLVFQLPSHIPWHRRIQPRRRAYALLRALGINAEFLYRTLGLAPMQMNSIPEAAVRRVLTAAGLRVVDVKKDALAGPEIESRMYFVVRLAAAPAAEPIP